MEIAGLIIGLISLIPVYFFLEGTFFSNGYLLDINFKNVMILPFLLSNGTITEKVHLIIYCLAITNSNDKPATVKSVHLQYKMNGSEYEQDSYVVNTGQLKSGEDNAALTKFGQAHIILKKWYNLRQSISELKVLEPGGVLSGSAVFPLEANANNLAEIKELKLVIRDYSNNKSAHELELQPEWTNGLTKGGYFINIKFTQQADDVIKFVR